jgi:hypothetical protein
LTCKRGRSGVHRTMMPVHTIPANIQNKEFREVRKGTPEVSHPVFLPRKVGLSFFTTLPLLLSTLSLAGGCARFRIEELNPNLIVAIPFYTQASHNDPDQLIVPVNDRLITDLPIQPAMGDGVIYLPDSSGERIRSYSQGSGKPEAIYTSEPASDGSKFAYHKIRVGIPGWVAANDNGMLYIQSFPLEKPARNAVRENTAPEDRLPGRLNFESVRISPSRILQVDSSGQTLATIGVGGSGGDAFLQIYRMDAYEDLLYVTHNEGEGRILTVYRNGSPVRHYAFTPPASPEEQRNFHIDVEEIVPSFSDEFAFVSVAYRNKKSFEPAKRRIFKVYSDGRNKQLLQVDDASDYFAYGKSDGGFYLMNSEEDGSGVLFKIYSADGEYLNNRKVKFPGIRASWRNIYITPDGKFLCTRIHHGQYELYEWK